MDFLIFNWQHCRYLLLMVIYCINMPESTQNYSTEVKNGTNLRSVKCKFCNSVILSPATATFIRFEFDLPLMSQKKDTTSVDKEKTLSFWQVNDMFIFQNVGFSNTVENTKYLTCADCEAGPIGYHDLNSKNSYVALSRVEHV